MAKNWLSRMGVVDRWRAVARHPVAALGVLLGLVLALGIGAVAQISAAEPPDSGDAASALELFDDDAVAPPGAPESAQDIEAKRRFSVVAGRKYPTRVYFGDTHTHTANSGDAFIGGDRLTPEKAYRFARGEEVVSSSGVPAKLARPLDFLVIADHVEGLGVMMQAYEGNLALVVDPVAARWNRALRAGGTDAIAATEEIVSAQANRSMPPVFRNQNVIAPVMRSVWHDYIATADRFNEPGRFTALIGFEWTSSPGGDNLHRNVVFRDGKERAGQMLPFSTWQSNNPERLWDWMEQYEKRTGGRVLAIPHNANLSNGRMFELADFSGKPISRDYAERRSRWEVLQEVMQTKGSSETHPALSPNDEFANFGIRGWDNGNLSLEGKPATEAMRPYMYLRWGLLQGLQLERQLSVNPFRFGFIGGTDVHNSLSAVSEDNFYGKYVHQEPRPNRWSAVSRQGLGFTRYNWNYEAAGYAAVWATENTREALWDAMMRREVYATSGTRMTVRLFGGWNFEAADASSRQLADAGYAKGVPMGGSLPPPPNGAKKPPSFLVAAMKDALGGNLDRIQIVKGWVDGGGKLQERVYDVVWGDAATRKPGKDGRLPPVGDTVDVTRATWTNSIGDPELAGVWKDPDFDPAVGAYYYLRVLEIPTPRWTAYDASRFKERMSAEVPMTQQERAWSSPIWYTPR